MVPFETIRDYLLFIQLVFVFFFFFFFFFCANRHFNNQPKYFEFFFIFQILALKMSIIKDLKFQMITAICWIKIELKKSHAARSLISLSRRTVQHITQSCFIPVSFCAWVGSVIYDPIHCDLFSYFTIDHLMHFQLTKLCSMFCASRRRLKTRKRI